MRITEPGAYDMSAEDYHADCCPEPSLSSSIVKMLVNDTPQHCFVSHPRLNPNFEHDEDDKFVIGNVAHNVMLNDTRGVAVLQYDDYRKKEAQEAKANAKAGGLIPVLEKHMCRVLDMVAAGRAQLLSHRDAAGAFMNGKPERTLVWCEEHGGMKVWFRIRPDWEPDDHTQFFDDYKTTECADPDSWQRVVDSVGHDIQAAFYRRGIRAVFGVRAPKMRFVVQETKDPYALSVVDLSPEYFDLAERRIERGIQRWVWCRQNGQWPGYPARTCTLAPREYNETRQMEREEREAEFARANGLPDQEVLALWTKFHAPL